MAHVLVCHLNINRFINSPFAQAQLAPMKSEIHCAHHCLLSLWRQVPEPDSFSFPGGMLVPSKTE
jgi:hypothetical protein